MWRLDKSLQSLANVCLYDEWIISWKLNPSVHRSVGMSACRKPQATIASMPMPLLLLLTMMSAAEP